MYTRKCFLLCLITLGYIANSVYSCSYPGAPAHSTLTFSAPKLAPGVAATYACERGFELLGPSRRVCNEHGKWIPEGIPFCVLNVALGKAPMQSSVAGNGVPQKAVDGSPANFFNPNTCSLTQPERAPWFYINLLEPYMVQLVRLDFGKSCCGENGALEPASIVVRVGNNRPDLGVNPVCNRFTGVIEEGKPLFLPCNPPIAGAFVSIQLEGPPGNVLSICESFVYTDQALPIERCPQFRDQPPGSTATYNGNCYIFYNQQSLRFEEARAFCHSRGGSLVDDSNPALQGFLSWEMWRRHRTDPTAQYWLGAIRDPKEPVNWKWLNGKDVTVSFWNLPGGRGNCARFDGAKGWLWSDTNCNEQLNFICQHGPRGCGRPEQPPNSTLLATSLDIGARIEHRCDSGHLLVGPETRTCLPNGFYSEFPPVCRYLECGFPASIPFGHYTLLNESRGYQSIVRYSCDEGHVMVGRNDLMCDLDAKWNGGPPRCEPLVCPEPPQIINGFYNIEALKQNAFVVNYECNPGFGLIGPEHLVCNDGVYDQPPPVCRLAPLPINTGAGIKKPDLITRGTTPSTSSSSSSSKPEVADEDIYGPRVGSEGQDYIDQYSESLGEHDENHLSDNGFQLGSGDIPSNKHTSSGEDSQNNVLRTTTEKLEDSDSPDVVILHPSESGNPTLTNDLNYDASNIIQKKPNPIDSSSKILHTKESAVARLNLGGIIALGVFGGFILLAAIVTSIVLLIRRGQVRGKHERHRGSPDSHTITSVDSGSDAGLGRLYRRAWDSLAATGAGAPNSTSTHITHMTDKSRRGKDTLDFRSRMGSSIEGLRDDGEMIVHDALPQRKHHHHHHGGHHHHSSVHGLEPSISASDWARSVRSHRSRY